MIEVYASAPNDKGSHFLSRFVKKICIIVLFRSVELLPSNFWMMYRPKVEYNLHGWLRPGLELVSICIFIHTGAMWLHRYDFKRMHYHTEVCFCAGCKHLSWFVLLLSPVFYTRTCVKPLHLPGVGLWRAAPVKACKFLQQFVWHWSYQRLW